jgi:hypothetical protein
MNRKTLVILCIALLAVVAAVFALMYQETTTPESATAQAVRQGAQKIVCEDAIWLSETFMQLVIEKEAQIPEEVEDNFTIKEFESMPTASQELVNAWHDGVIQAAAETYVQDEQKLEMINYKIGRQFMEIYQAVMLVKLEVSEQDVLMEALTAEFCAE